MSPETPRGPLEPIPAPDSAAHDRSTQRLARLSIGLSAIPELGSDGYVRVLGRAFVLSLHGAMRVLRMYPAENPVVQKTVEELAGVAEDLRADAGELEARIAGEFLFLNRIRLRLDLENFATVDAVLRELRQSGIGTLKVLGPASATDWLALIGALNSPAGDDPAARLHHFRHRLGSAGVSTFDVEPPVEDTQRKVDAESKDPAKSAYAKSVAAIDRVMEAVRSGQRPNLRILKRTVQLIVDRVLADEASMLGLTTLRDHGDPGFTHAVNVCVFAVSLGRRLGLSRVQLYDLGLAALFHDCGQSRIPPELLNKPAPLTHDDWVQLSSHPWQGVLMLCHLREHNEFPYRTMMVAYEHHLRPRGGYPERRRPRPVGLFSRIIAVIEIFDAATSRASQHGPARAPADFIVDLRARGAEFCDGVIVRAFCDMLGLYPVGTVLLLDTGELAVATFANSDPELLDRPQVLIISDADGNITHPGTPANLADRVEGAFRRTVIETVDAERYGIRVGDYFL